MARKAHDLFDVFQLSQDADTGTRERGERRKAAAASKAKAKRPRVRKPKPKSKSGQGTSGQGTFPETSRMAPAGGGGVALNRRQVFLAGSAMLLLLVLSFTLGLATGRPSDKQDGAALNRVTSFVIRGRLPLTDPTTRNPVDTTRIRRQISSDYKIPSPNVMMRREGSDLVIDIGPWPSRQAAERFWNRSGLKLVHIHLEDPFRWAKIVPYSARP